MFVRDINDPGNRIASSNQGGDQATGCSPRFLGFYLHSYPRGWSGWMNTGVLPTKVKGYRVESSL